VIFLKLVTADEMKEIDGSAIHDYGMPSLVLMENAGLRVIEFLDYLLKDHLHMKRVAIFVGKGNNGGDGLVVARHLLNKGVDVKVFLLGREEDLKGDALVHYMVLIQMQAKIYTILNEKDLKRVQIGLTYTDLIIDAIYGTGFKDNMTALMQEIVNIINKSDKAIISIDIPSGVDASNGMVSSTAIRADYTITLGLVKIGLCLESATPYVGELWLGDISLPNALIIKDSQKNMITSKLAGNLLPERSPNGHKGTFGHALVIGGSEGLSGSVVLAGEAALHTGCGLVTLGIPKNLNQIIEMKTTEIMSKPLPETDAHTISAEALEILAEPLQKVDALIIGPGISRNPITMQFVENVLRETEKPIVLDADGLNVLVGNNDLLSQIKTPMVLTPHPGEMAKIMGITIEQVQENRVELAKHFATMWKKVVVLKGAKTIVALPDGSIYLNLTGNSGMGTGGSGDVLSGIIGSLIAQGLNVAEASILGVYIHGASGDIAKEELGERTMLASDLIRYTGKLLQKLEEVKLYQHNRHNLVRIF
jgi:hydroxyethylthiazole kinase-like uncharacterized protein yjeF